MKRNLIISVAIIAVLAAYLYITNRKSTEVPDLPVWEGSSDEIIIKRPAVSIRLLRKEGKWAINEEAYPASKTAVEGIEKIMRELSIADLVSEKGMYSSYDLNPEKSMEVTVRKDGDLVRHIVFGKKSSASQHTFIRIGAAKEIYMASGTFDTLLDATVDSLRDKEIIKLARNDVTSLSFTCKGKTVNFALETVTKKEVKGKGKGKDAKKVESQWVSRGAEPILLDVQRMNSLLKLFDPLTAKGFVDTAKESLKNPLATAVIKTSKKEVTIRLYEKDDEYYAATSESPFVFTINEWTAKKFMIENVDIFKADQ